jgi:TonB family protein
MGDQVARVSFLNGKDAIVKYGEKGKDGVYEIMSVKKAAELGIKVPFRRRNPEDFPTFRGEKLTEFTNWVIDNVKYPAEAQSKGIQGRVYVNFTVELDGSLSNITVTGAPDPLLGEAVRTVVKSSPLWEPAKNPKVKEALPGSLTVKFVLPDKVLPDDAFVMVEKMPQFPGEDAALMKFIRDHIQYPPEAVKDTIQGRVIVRFVVNMEGKVEDVTVLKSVHPLLDAEARRVVYSLPSWIPATQGGTPRSVYYSMPVSFLLQTGKQISGNQGQPMSESSMSRVMRSVQLNIVYPQVAREISDTGKVYVAVKMIRGGTISECKVFTDKGEIIVPVLNEIVVAGHNSADAPRVSGSKNASENDHQSLKNECLRVARKLTVNEVPEWKDFNVEFALAFKFVLK